MTITFKVDDNLGAAIDKVVYPGKKGVKPNKSEYIKNLIKADPAIIKELSIIEKKKK